MITLQNVGRKVTSTVISAVLLLYMAFPITDFQKPERAYANPGVAVLVGTAAAAFGVLVGGATVAQYDANLQALYDGFSGATSQWTASWQQYVQDQGSFDQAVNSCVTANGEIQLATLQEHGFFDSLESYTAYCVNQGTMQAGNTSTIQMSALKVNGYKFAVVGDSPENIGRAQNYVNQCVSQGYDKLVGFKKTKNGSDWDYNYYFGRSYDFTVTRASSNISGAYTLTCSGGFMYAYMQIKSDNSINTSRSQVYTVSTFDMPSNYYNEHATNGNYMAFTYSANPTMQNATTEPYYGSVMANVSDDVLAGTATQPTATVQPFEPTAEQLANGYTSADIVEAINSGNAQTNASLDGILSAITTTLGGILNDIKTGVNGLETTIGNALTGALGSVLSGISTTVGTISTTLGDIWGGVQGWYTDWLAWVGATPLGQLIAQIIAALQAGVISLSQAIAAVQTAVQTAVTDLVGAIESIQIPTFELPTVTLPYANLNGGSGTADLMDGSAAHVSAFQSLLNDKEPFCYLFAFSNGMQQVQANNSAARFRIQHRFDILGQPLDVDINAEPYLLRDVGGTTIADLLRSSMTLTLCMGLLYSAYRTALRAVKS